MFRGWEIVPCGYQVMFIGKGKKSPFRDGGRQASGTEKEVQGPFMDLNPKAKAAGLSQDCVRVREGSRKAAPFPPSSCLLRQGPLPGLGPSQHPAPPPFSWWGGRQKAFRGGCAGWAVFPEQGARQD